jgi:VWFA-related protein
MARTSRSLALSAALLILLGAAGTAQRASGQATPEQKPADQPAPPQPPPLFRAGINFVRVDVIVSDKSGSPISDLKLEDFEVVEEGKSQKVETFKLVSLDGGLMPGPGDPPRAIHSDFDEESEAARDDVRLFAIFLDDYHVRQDSSLVAREQLARFVETQLGPSDMVCVMYPLEPTSALRFTRNHEAVAKGLRQFTGRKYDYRPKNNLEEGYVYKYPAETVERIRNQVSLSALESLATHMGGLKEGRKSLILVSEGYTNMLPPQMRDPVAGIQGLGNPNQFNPQAGQNDPLEDRASTLANWDMESDLREVYTVANRYNVAIYSVDPRGLANFEFGIDGPSIGIKTDSQYLRSTQETLRTLSLLTDGRAIVNRNDLTMGMKQIIRDSSAYYLLGYTSSLAKSDGKFHEIKVRVKRPGVTVRSRKGYWAFSTEDVAKATAPPKPGPPKAVEHALAAAIPSRSRIIRTWVGSERGENGKTRMTFVWEPVPKLPGEPARDSDQVARVSLTAAGDDGAPYFRGRIPESSTGLPANGAVAGARVSFSARPGKMQLRLTVEGAGSEVLDSETREIVVPDLTAPQTQLGTPEILKARTVRDLQQLKADPQAVPSAAREFSRTDRVVVRVPVYGPGASDPTVTARLLGRAGNAIADLVVSSATATLPSQMDVPVAGLAPGEYLVEIKAAGDGGEATELVGFRVTG